MAPAFITFRHPRDLPELCPANLPLKPAAGEGFRRTAGFFVPAAGNAQDIGARSGGSACRHADVPVGYY